ncbi:MAG: serine/threonine-protein kinase [Planctomycetaceae bacterium]
MNSSYGEAEDELGPLMDEFLTRKRRGEYPSLTEFVNRHPDLEDEIRELFPAVAMIEQAGGSENKTSGTGDAAREGRQFERLGDYRIIREIGRGGMGVVFEAIQESLGRHVALKLLPWQIVPGDSHVKRFQREAKIAAALHHTNIVPVFSVGDIDGIHFFAMQYIRGESLDAVLSELRKLQIGAENETDQINGNDQNRQSNDVSERIHSAVMEETGPGSGCNPALEFLSKSCSSNSEDLPLSNSASCSSQAHHSKVGESFSVSVCSTLTTSEQYFFRRVAEIGVQIADALEYAHGQGVLHRDVKPANLILDTQGAVWLTDFGLARTSGSSGNLEEATEPLEDLTRTGDLVGTLRYMAPERFSGRADERSDIYGLGLTLYELMTRQPAFDAVDRAQLINKITTSSPVDPRRLLPRIPGDLETIVLKSVASLPANRYPSAADLSNDLRRFLQGEPILARRTPPHERFFLWCRRNRMVAVLGGLVTTLLLAFTITSLVSGYQLSERHRRVLENLQRAESAENDLRTANALANRHLLQSYAAQARAERSSFRAGRRFNALKAIESASTLLDKIASTTEDRLMLRNEAIAAMALDDIRIDVEHQLTGSVSVDRSLGFDGPLLRCVDFNATGQLEIISVVDGRTIERIDGNWATEVVLPCTRFSNDGRFLAVRGYTRDSSMLFVVHDLSTSQLCASHQFAGDPESIDCLCFLPDSHGIATAIGSTLMLFDLPTGVARTQWNLSEPPAFVKFSTDGAWLATENNDLVSLMHTDGSGDTHTIPHTNGTNDVAWSPGNRYLATASQDKNIYTWDLKLRTIHTASRGHSGAVTRVAFNPAGNILMSTSTDATTRLWNPLLGPEILRTDQQAARFSNDGHQIGFAQPGKTVGRWDVVGGDFCQTFCINVWDDQISDEIKDISFHPAGRQFAITSDYGISLFSWPEGKIVQQRTLDGEASMGKFSPNGNTLITCTDKTAEKWDVVASCDSCHVNIPESGDTIFTSPEADLNMFAANHDQSHFIAGDAKGRFRRLQRNSETKDPIGFLHQQSDHNCCDLSPDSRFAAFSGTSSRIVSVRHMTSAVELSSITLPTKGARVKFSPDSATLAISLAGEVWILQTSNWQVLKRMRLDSISIGNVAFSPNGKLLAIQRPDTIQLRSAYDFRVLAEFTAPYGERFCTIVADQAAAISFNSDSNMLANGTRVGTVHVWDLDAIRNSLQDLNLNWADDYEQ